MRILSTRQMATKLGINAGTLSRYIAAKKVPAPKVVQFGNLKVHAWTEKDIERMRKLLAKIENGRKTRYQQKKKRNATIKR
jgi:predicted DNA-binding transcriptional regulator AlpA